jgi:hypothetical protein
MSVKKKHYEVDTFYFITFTCLKWNELFEITSLYDNIYSGLKNWSRQVFIIVAT